ncbi:MAG: hypothetical protein IJV73_00080 [Clostridia bacterium]|nr:hypothetical protein [Clostridia bacterium]
MKIDWIKLKEQCKKYIWHNLLVLLCGVLSLAFLVLAVVAVFSTQKNEGIAVKEAFDISSAPLDANGKQFVSQLNGYLINYEDRAARVESIVVIVGDGREREEIELDGMTLHPRLAEEIRHEWQTSFDFDRVHSVTVVADGERLLLANSTAAWEFNPDTILYAILCALSCFGTIFAFKKRYYRYQEDQIAARNAEQTVE